jgi:formate-dependent nitrite reductase membrane component NrfD
MFLLYLLGIAIMGGVIYLAISRKSSLKIRLAALGALALMVTSVIICFVIFFRSAKGPQVLILPDMLPSDMPPPQPATNPVMMVMFSIFLVGLFVVIFLMAMRENRRSNNKELPPENEW